jgi:hypothetical protein
MALNTVKLNVYAECHNYADYAECRQAECRYAECRGAKKTVMTITYQVEQHKQRLSLLRLL